MCHLSQRLIRISIRHEPVRPSWCSRPCVPEAPEPSGCLPVRLPVARRRQTGCTQTGRTRPPGDVSRRSGRSHAWRYRQVSPARKTPRPSGGQLPQRAVRTHARGERRDASWVPRSRLTSPDPPPEERHRKPPYPGERTANRRAVSSYPSLPVIRRCLAKLSAAECKYGDAHLCSLSLDLPAPRATRQAGGTEHPGGTR